MARFILAFLAVLALAVAPVTASARMAACGMDMSQAMAASTAMGDMPAAHQADAAKMDPCCDKTRGACSKSCAMICLTSSACLAPIPTVVVLEARYAFSLPEDAAWRSHEPIGPDHPPKSLA
jgi:hypothetical protein